jgi:predicted lipoprotein
MRIFLLVFLMLTKPAFAGVEHAIEITQKHYAMFAETASNLHEKALHNCSAQALITPYNDAFDAWVVASTTSFGPIQDIGGPLAVSFWPDKKGFTLKALNKLIASENTDQLEPGMFSEQSIASKGFMALDRLLFDPQFNAFDNASFTCKLVQAITNDLQNKAEVISQDWGTTYASTLQTAGEAGNSTFLSKNEIAQAYLTTLSGTLEFAITARLARPIGTFEKPRPKRAEAWRSNRPLRNIEVSLNTVSEFLSSLSNDLPETESVIKSAQEFIANMESSDFQTLDQLSTRFKIESLQSLMVLAQEALTIELSKALNVSTGFNALDGD